MLGVDVGARFLRGALCDLSGTIRARRDDALPRADADEVLPAIVRMRDRLVAAAGLPAGLIDAVVVGVPGVVEADGGAVRLAANVRGLEDRHFGAELEPLLGHAVTVENDVNLAALGEGRDGVARGVENFFVLSIGTGLGGGLVLGGELQRGQHGAAGEMDFARAGVEQDFDVSAEALSALAAAHAAGAGTALAPPSTRAPCSPPPARATPSPAPWSTRRPTASPATSPRSPPWPTSASSCWAAASAPTPNCWTASAAGWPSGCPTRRAWSCRAWPTAPC